MKTTAYISFFFAFCLIAFSCKKDDEENITTTAKNDTTTVDNEQTLPKVALNFNSSFPGDTLILFGESLKAITPKVFFNDTEVDAITTEMDSVYNIVVPDTETGTISVILNQDTVNFDFYLLECSCELFSKLEISEFKFTDTSETDKMKYSFLLTNPTDSYVSLAQTGYEKYDFISKASIQHYVASDENGTNEQPAGGTTIGYNSYNNRGDIIEPNQSMTIRLTVYKKDKYLKVQLGSREGTTSCTTRIVYDGKVE